MSNNLRAVVPANISIPKKYAKYLNNYFPFQKLSKCQAVTALLYGHADWHNLEQAIKNKVESGPYNEDLIDDIDAIDERANNQISIIAKELGGVENIEADIVADSFLKMPPDEAYVFADKRFSQLLAETIIEDSSPTYKKPIIYPEINPARLIFPKNLTELIGIWWFKNIPYQKEVGSFLETFKLDVNSRLSLIWFARYWGSLSRFYESIPESLKMGIAYMLAYRFAELALTGDYDVVELRKELDAKRIKPEEYQLKIQEMHNQEIKHFFKAYPMYQYFICYITTPEDVVKSMKVALKHLQRS